jgi:adenosylcobinamide-phosphate synthase
VISCLAVLLGAAVLDLAAGEPPSEVHPVVWMGKFIEGFWNRRPLEGRVLPFLFGVVLVISGALLFSLPLLVLRFLPVPFHILASILLLKISFSLRGLSRAAAEVLRALEKGDLKSARERLGWHLVSRKTDSLDEGEVVSAVIESLAENITDSITSPLFYFAFAGLPGAWAYRFCNTCDAMIGYRDPEHEYGGKFAARMDDILNWIPARITGFLMLIAGVLAGEDGRNGSRTMILQHGRTESPNAGWTMAVMAGLLGVRLSKRGNYVIDGGTNGLTPSAVRRGMKVFHITAIMVFVFIFILIGGLYVLSR